MATPQPFGIWPPVIPAPTIPNIVVAAWATVNGDGTVQVQSSPGWIDTINHVPLTGLYQLNVLPAFVQANNRSAAARNNAAPGMCDSEVAALGAVVNVNMWNASGSATEDTFTVLLLQQSPAP